MYTLTGKMYEDYRSQIMFFCGNTPDCIEFNSSKALKKAMAVVEENFSVVGILENLNKTFYALENYVPRFFENIKKTFDTSKEDSKYKNVNPHKKNITDQLRTSLRQKFSNEVEFYEFCKQRLHRQAEALTQWKSKSETGHNELKALISDFNQNKVFILL